MQSSQRVAWVDYAKGLAIIGVFILHSNAPENVIHAIDMFCMPLFFLLSGFVFSIYKHPSFRSFLWNKLRTLIFPGVFFAVVPFAITRVIGTISGDVWGMKTYAKWFLGLAVNLRGHEGFGSIPWFLVCLFVVEIGGYILLRLFERVPSSTTAFVGIGITSILIGYMYSIFIHIVLPWEADIALSMFGFFVFGYAMRDHREEIEHCGASPRSHCLSGAAGGSEYAELSTTGQRVYEHVRQHRILPGRGILRHVGHNRDLHYLGTYPNWQIPLAGNHLLRAQHFGVLLCECTNLRQLDSIHLGMVRIRYQWWIHNESTIVHAGIHCRQSDYLFRRDGGHESLAARSVGQKANVMFIKQRAGG